MARHSFDSMLEILADSIAETGDPVPVIAADDIRVGYHATVDLFVPSIKAVGLEPHNSKERVDSDTMRKTIQERGLPDSVAKMFTRQPAPLANFFRSQDKAEEAAIVFARELREYKAGVEAEALPVVLEYHFTKQQIEDYDIQITPNKEHVAFWAMKVVPAKDDAGNEMLVKTIKVKTSATESELANPKGVKAPDTVGDREESEESEGDPLTPAGTDELTEHLNDMDKEEEVEREEKGEPAKEEEKAPEKKGEEPAETEKKEEAPQASPEKKAPEETPKDDKKEEKSKKLSLRQQKTIGGILNIPKPYLFFYVYKETKIKKERESLQDGGGTVSGKKVDPNLEKILAKFKAAELSLKMVKKVEGSSIPPQSLRVYLLRGKEAGVVLTNAAKVAGLRSGWADMGSAFTDYLSDQKSDPENVEPLFSRVTFTKYTGPVPDENITSILEAYWKKVAKPTADEEMSKIEAMQIGNMIPLTYSRFLSEESKQRSYYAAGRPPEAGNPGMNYILCEEPEFDFFKTTMTSFGATPSMMQTVNYGPIDAAFTKFDPKPLSPQNCLILTAKSKFYVAGEESGDPVEVARTDITELLDNIEKLKDKMSEVSKSIIEKVKKANIGNKWESSNAESVEDIEAVKGFPIGKAADAYLTLGKSLWKSGKATGTGDKLEWQAFDILVGNKVKEFCKAAGVPDELVKYYPQWKAIRLQKTQPDPDMILTQLQKSKSEEDLVDSLLLIGMPEDDAKSLAKAMSSGNLDTMNKFANDVLKNTSSAGSFVRGDIVGSMVVHFNRDYTKAICWGSYSPITVTKEAVIAAMPFVSDVDYTFSK